MPTIPVKASCELLRIASLIAGAQRADIKHKMGIRKIGQDLTIAGIVWRANRKKANAKYPAAKYLIGIRNGYGSTSEQIQQNKKKGSA